MIFNSSLVAQYHDKEVSQCMCADLTKSQYHFSIVLRIEIYLIIHLLGMDPWTVLYDVSFRPPFGMHVTVTTSKMLSMVRVDIRVVNNSYNYNYFSTCID